MRLVHAAACLALLAGCLCDAEGRGAELTAGVARVDLTPPATMKAALGGYGDRMSRPAEGVHDRVFAKALVVAGASKRFALVTADVLAFPPPIKPAVVERLSGEGWGSGQIMLLPSHSHTSIDMSAIHPENKLGIPQIGVYQAELYEWVVERLAGVIREAGRRPVPVAVGTSRKRLAGWNRNRRGSEGPVDDDLTVTRIDTREDRPLAILFQFTAHPTLMLPEHMLFSGGWPGHAQRTVEALAGDGVAAMFYNGAQGDQAPVARPDSGPSRWEVAERYGRELGIEVWKLWDATSPDPTVAFAFHDQPIDLPDRTWHADFLATGGKEYALSEMLLRTMLPRLFPDATSSVSLRLGDLVIVGVPGELTAELGLRLKAEAARAAGVEHAVIGGLADAWLSYILSEAEYRKGGYEASVSFYGPTLGETIVAGALEGVKRLASP